MKKHFIIVLLAIVFSQFSQASETDTDDLIPLNTTCTSGLCTGMQVGAFCNTYYDSIRDTYKNQYCRISISSQTDAPVCVCK